MSYKAIVTVSACAFAGLAVLGFGRGFRKWRQSNLDFDFPIDNLFV